MHTAHCSPRPSPSRPADIGASCSHPLAFPPVCPLAPPPPSRADTGPMFVKYNGVLRGLGSGVPFLQARMTELCMGNRYTTSICAINSALVKLSKLTRVCKVYRGLSGSLPSQFWQPNAHGVCGGVEAAFLSATPDLDVAMAYASGAASGGVLFEMQMGMTSRGADLSWISQYPEEKEVHARRARYVRVRRVCTACVCGVRARRACVRCRGVRACGAAACVRAVLRRVCVTYVHAVSAPSGPPQTSPPPPPLAATHSPLPYRLARAQFCFAPLLGLSVISTRVQGAILVVELGLAVNHNAMTLEQAVSGMQRSHTMLLSLTQSALADVAPKGALGALRGLAEDAELQGERAWPQPASCRSAAAHGQKPARAAPMARS